MKKQFDIEDIVRISDEKHKLTGRLFEVIYFTCFLGYDNVADHHYTLKDIHNGDIITPERTQDIILVKPKGKVTSSVFDIMYDAYLDVKAIHEFINRKEVRGEKRRNNKYLQTAIKIKDLMKRGM